MIEEIQERIDDLTSVAKLVSNLNDWRTDNTAGREVVFLEKVLEFVKAQSAEVSEWKKRAERAEVAIKGCSVGACPTLAQLAMEDMGWETPLVAAGVNENPPHKSPLPNDTASGSALRASRDTSARVGCSLPVIRLKR